MRYCCFLLFALCCAAQSITIRMEGGAFRVAGFEAGEAPADGWPSVFQVFAGQGDLPPLLGSYAVEGSSLVFHPRFPVAPGMRIRAVFRGQETVFDIPKIERQSTTRLLQVYPTAAVLPENQLKFYLYFSAPMSRGEAWRRIHLIGPEGKAVDLPFLEIDQELWDPEARRLTVLFDPGRIKRGVLPLEQVGPAIESGKQYTLVIDRDWLDGAGAPLTEDFRKAFRVAAADRKPPDPAQWRITAPRVGGSGDLVVDLRKPLDYALLQRSIAVTGPDGTVSGTVAVGREETEWRLTPAQPWKAGEYKLVIQSTLEDLAGNHILRAFDVDTFERITKEIPRDTVSVPFRISR